MKKSFLLFLSIGILFTSCENQLDNLPVEEIGQELKTKVVVKFNTTKALDVEEASNVFDVSIEELKAYMANQTIMSIPSSNPNARTISQETIEPIVSGTDTVMYLVNYPEGWCLFSGDKRTPAILAYSETGSLSMNDINTHPGLSVWVDDKIDRIGVLKGTIDYNEESLYLKDWAQFDSNIYIVSTTSNEDEDKTWVVIGTENRVDNDVIISPQISTVWGQTSPWNNYVPYKSNSTTERCPAGCVAVATAQMLYYLHHRIGYPQTMPSTGSCVGNVGSGNYTQTFSNFTSSVFNNMALTKYESSIKTDNSARMIGYVGMLLDTDYGNDSSGADFDDIGERVFDENGISYNKTDYDGASVFSAIRGGSPVLVAAYSDRILGIINTNGHAWIIDGGKYTSYSYDIVYAFLNDSLYNATGEIPADTEIKYITTNGIKNPMVRMNWGWGIIDEIYYSPFDDWSVSNVTYQYNKRVYKNFSHEY